MVFSFLVTEPAVRGDDQIFDRGPWKHLRSCMYVNTAQKHLIHRNLLNSRFTLELRKVPGWPSYQWRIYILSDVLGNLQQANLGHIPGNFRNLTNQITIVDVFSRRLCLINKQPAVATHQLLKNLSSSDHRWTLSNMGGIKEVKGTSCKSWGHKNRCRYCALCLHLNDGDLRNIYPSSLPSWNILIYPLPSSIAPEVE